MNALVTGASKGIGKTVVIELAKAGFNSHIVARSENELIKALQEVKTANNSLSPLYTVADLSKKESFKEISDKSSELDILFHNAGMFLTGNMLKEDDQQFETQLRLNFYPSYYLTKALYQAKKLKAGSHIFIMCSSASLAPLRGAGSYSISKYAVLGVAENLREVLKKENIKVTAIIPGSTDSSSWDDSEVDKSKLIQPEDIAASILNAYHLSKSAVVDRIIINPIQPI